MERFRNILVAAAPGQLEPTVLRAAVKLAAANDARLTILDVVPPVPRRRKTIRVGDHVVDIEAAMVHDREEQLRLLVEGARTGANIEVAVRVGEPFREVIRHVLAHSNDLVVVGGSEVAKPAVPAPSSGVMSLLRKCPVPLWVMRPSQARKLRVLALVDPDPTDRVRDSLNDLVLELATSLTRRESAELHVGHAWSLAGEGTLRSSPYVGLPPGVVDALVQDAEASHREDLDVLVDRHRVRDLGGTLHLAAGDPGKVLPDLADQLDVGLIVMGTVARTGLSGLVMGNTADTILRAVRCSVLALKPPGFMSPVHLDEAAQDLA